MAELAVNVFDIYGRQKLVSRCTLPYNNQWFEFCASLPVSSMLFLSYALFYMTDFSLPGKLVFLSLFGVELTHAWGHLFLTPRIEEVIIFFYFWFNLFFMYIVYESPVTAGSWWRLIYRSKEAFLAGYVFGAAILIFAWYQYGYLASTVLQSCIQCLVAVSTALHTQKARSAMRKWTAVYLFGISLLVTEILWCGDLMRTFGVFPYHAGVDAVLGVSCYFQCCFICELLRVNAEGKNNE